MKAIIGTDVTVSNGDRTKPNDDFVIERSDYTLGLSGIVLNSEQMNPDDVVKNITEGGTQRLYKGSYVLWLHDRKNERLYVANDLLSKQSVYYYAKDGLILVNTSLFDLCTDLRDNGRTPVLNLGAAKELCREQVLSGDMTYEADTSFLTAYSYLVIDCREKTLEVRRLPIPKMKRVGDISEEQAIEDLNRLFSEACRLEWEKNEAYGTDQIMTLSGGMDSRATFLRTTGGRDQSRVKTYTYAQSGSIDARISKRFTEKHQVKNTFIPLDDCEFAYLRDEIIDANEGQMYYAGSTGAILIAKKMRLSQDNMGIVHTGLGGGEILGDICIAGGDRAVGDESGITINQQRNLDDIRRCLNFQKTTANYFSAFSPFLYEDFFEYAMCLPIAMRSNRKLYIEWYKKYMGSEFPSKGSYSPIVKTINRVVNRICRELGQKSPLDMNPFKFWYKTQPKLREYVSTAWENDCELLGAQQELLKTLKPYYEQEVKHKFSALTVTASAIRILGLSRA